MVQVFLHILNMSISAGYIVLAVLLLRPALKKAPKWISVVLWGIVAVRLACPFSMESVLSLIPSAETVSPGIMTEQTPSINTGIPMVNSALNPVIGESFAPNPGDSANPLQIWIPILTAIWIAGVVALLVYTVISYAKVKRKIGTAVLLRENIYQSENVISPFVLGIIKPKIYLPFDMNDKNTEHVVAHETAHIHRKDHLWKPLGFLLLTLHWFNPLMWLGYVLLCRDIELACDEKVIKELDHDARADYSEALLTCSVNRRMIAACPLAFGEVGVKDRVKSVLNYKKPAFWITIAAVVACVAVAVCFLTVPKDGKDGGMMPDPDRLTEEQRYLLERNPEYFGLDASDGLDVYVWQMAKNSYSFGLLPHAAQGRDRTSSELLSLRGTSAAEMRTILSVYNVDENDIYIISWHNPLSSYLGEWQIVTDGEDRDAKKQAYVERIRQMLFSETEPAPEEYYLATATFDIDNDGVEEICTMSCSSMGEMFAIVFCAKEAGKDDMEYETIIYSQPYALSFQEGAGGVMRVQGIDQEGKVHMFDISIVGKSVYLTENGFLIGEVFSWIKYSLLYDDPSLSWTLNSDEVPFVEIKDGKLYEKTADASIELGSVIRTTTEQADFNRLKEAYGGWYKRLVNEILEDNEAIYRVEPKDRQGVSLYYVMYQKDGSTLLVYGHYENGEKSDFIRWIFQLANPILCW